MSDLTQRQTEIFDFIRSRLHDTGFPPTREDIARQFGFSSKTGAQDHLMAIARKGYIELVPGNARGIRLLKGDLAAEGPTHQFELPLIGSIAAGTPITAETNVDTWLKIDPELFHPRADFLHRVAGHSMKEANILDGGVRILATAATTGQTGVEMEALTAASIAALTVYDMTKALDKSIVIRSIQLEQKSGGKSGDYKRS